MWSECDLKNSFKGTRLGMQSCIISTKLTTQLLLDFSRSLFNLVTARSVFVAVALSVQMLSPPQTAYTALTEVSPKLLRSNL